MFRNLLMTLVVLALGVSAVDVDAAEVSALNTPREKTSYAFGVDVGRNIRRMVIDIEPDAMVKGLRDALSGVKLLLTEEELNATLTALQNDLRQRQVAVMQKVAEDNKKAGEAFLAENKNKPGVVTLPDGLQYKIVQEGSGKKPTATDTVEVNYRGTLVNGTEFDSSFRRGQPAAFKVTDVIPGWVEALQLMPVGSKWQLVIPSKLAYGERGAGSHIPPNSTLVFEVELLAIK